MLKTFAYVWALYWIVFLLLPVHSLYPSTLAAFAVQGAFVLLVGAGYLTVRMLFYTDRVPSADRSAIASTRALIGISLLMSIVGLAALTYDKIYVQGIDYSQGLAVARNQWGQLGEERTGVSSVFSVIGYLFGSSYFVTIVLAITQVLALSTRERLLVLTASFCLVMANSVLTGGRSSLLLLAAFAIAAFTARKGLNIRGLMPNRWQRVFAALLILTGAGFAVFVFYQRADAGDLPPLTYAVDFLPWLNLEIDPWYEQRLDEGFLSSLSAMCVLALSYITHSFASVAAIIDAPSEDKTIVFLGPLQLLQTLGLAPEPDYDWFLVGRFPSVPGAFLHQFGWLGFGISSLIMGLVGGVVEIWTIRQPTRLLPLGAYVMAVATLALTPQLLAVDFLSFPFVVGSFVMLAAIDSVLRPYFRPHARVAPPFPTDLVSNRRENLS